MSLATAILSYNSTLTYPNFTQLKGRRSFLLAIAWGKKELRGNKPHNISHFLVATRPKNGRSEAKFSQDVVLGFLSQAFSL